MRRGRAFVAQPERDEGYVVARLEQVHGGRMTDRVRRDASLTERGARSNGSHHGEGKAPGDSRSGEAPSGSIRKERRVGCGAPLANPAGELPSGASPERHGPFLASLPVEFNARRTVEAEMTDIETDCLGDARSRVVERREEHAISSPGPGRDIGGTEDRFDLLAREVREDRARASLRGDGEETLDLGEGRGLFATRVSCEGAQRGEAGVSSADTVTPLALEVVEEGENERGREVVGREGRGGAPQTPLGEPQQEAKRITVGGDGSR